MNLIAITLMFAGSVAFAQSSFEAIGIPTMKKAVAQSFQQIPASPKCPHSGQQDFDKLASSRGGAMSSSQIMEGLLEQVSPQHAQLLTDSSHCGACQQVNEVAQFTTSQPEKVKQSASCNNRPTVNIQRELDNSEVQKFAADTLRGNTAEGKGLYQGCPDPCSFYVASATTATSAERSLLNLTVHCGQPRNGSILFAKYLYSAGLIHSWTCQ